MALQGRHLGLVFLLAASGLFGGGVRAAVPSTICIQGSMTGTDGQPLAGARKWRVQYYDLETGDGTLGGALTGTLTVNASGRWSISLTPQQAVLNAPGEVWYELAIDSAATPDGSIDPGDVFTERVRIDSVMFAQRAVNAERLGGQPAVNYVTNSHLTTTLIGYIQAGALNAALGEKSNVGHDHDDRYLTESETNAALTSGLAGKAGTGHTHNLQNLGGAVTDAQVPDDITIDEAGHAAAADLATTATVALALAGVSPGDLLTSAGLAIFLADYATNLGLTTILADYVTNAAMTSGLNGKADAAHGHDDRYYMESEIDTALGGKANTSHSHSLLDLDGAVTDAQVPDDITIDEAGHAAAADTATTASVALALAGVSLGDFVTSAGLTTVLDEYATDAELTTVLADYPTNAALATGLGGKADAAHEHDDRYYTESETDTALAGKASTSHSHNLQDLDGVATNAQVADDLTIQGGTVNVDSFSAVADLTAEGLLDNNDANDLLTRQQSDGRYLQSYSESDTLDDVTGRGATTANAVVVGGLTSGADVVLSATGAVYLGDPSSDGSWRIRINGDGDLAFEARVSGTWTNAAVMVKP